MSELESDVKQLQDELERQQVHLREADREKTRAVQELSEQNQRLLDQLSRVSPKLRIDGVKILTEFES